MHENKYCRSPLCVYAPTLTLVFPKGSVPCVLSAVENEREGFVLYVQRSDSLTISIWLTWECAWTTCMYVYMYIYSWCGGRRGVGMMANLAPRVLLIPSTSKRCAHGAFMSLGSAVLCQSLRREIRHMSETTKPVCPK